MFVPYPLRGSTKQDLAVDPYRLNDLGRSEVGSIVLVSSGSGFLVNLFLVYISDLQSIIGGDQAKLRT